jgi:hypothetical protein
MRTHRKHRFLYCCVLIHSNVFTAQLRSSKSGADLQRTPLARLFLLLRDVTAYVMRSSAACVQAVTDNGCFPALTVLYFEQIRQNIVDIKLPYLFI